MFITRKQGVSCLKVPDSFILFSTIDSIKGFEMVQNREPLKLPKDFDPEVNLPARNINGKVFHATISGMNLVAELSDYN